MKFTRIIEILLNKRHFYVSLQVKKSRWRNQRSGLPQDSVLSSTPFNIYTNDQPTNLNTKHFLYADDLAISSQQDTFEEVENTLTLALKEMFMYHKENHLRPNPNKTKTCFFHLRNRNANKELKIQ